jgi:hypothetical protein
LLEVKNPGCCQLWEYVKPSMISSAILNLENWLTK